MVALWRGSSRTPTFLCWSWENTSKYSTSTSCWSVKCWKTTITTTDQAALSAVYINTKHTTVAPSQMWWVHLRFTCHSECFIVQCCDPIRSLLTFSISTLSVIQCLSAQTYREHKNDLSQSKLDGTIFDKFPGALWQPKKRTPTGCSEHMFHLYIIETIDLLYQDTQSSNTGYQ